MIKKPQADEYPEYYKSYVELIPEDNILEFMEKQVDRFEEALFYVNEGDGLYSYEEGKWSIKELLGHIADAERILGVRALRFARKEKNDVLQYNHEDYVRTANFDDQPLDNLVEQFKVIRLNNILMFDSFDEEILMRKGKSGGKEFSVRAFPFILAGHAEHHFIILLERYLSGLKQNEV